MKELNFLYIKFWGLLPNGNTMKNARAFHLFYMVSKWWELERLKPRYYTNART